MPTKRQTRFLQAVAEAASSVKPSKPRGLPTPDNLTSEGRSKGLSAMHQAKRCRGTNRSGKPCMAPAMRGSTRCLKHGGRVEVPAHPHNIRRFFSGKMQRSALAQADRETGRDCWDAMSLSQQRELASVVSERVLHSPARLYEAARVWTVVKDQGYPAYKRFLDQFARA